MSEDGFVEVVTILEKDLKGELYSFGSNSYGQLGLESTDYEMYQPTPKMIKSTSPWNSFSTGMYHAAGTNTDGELYTWGLGESGQNGRKSALGVTTPTIVSQKDWKKVRCGDFFTIVQDGEDFLYGFGKNDCGQLGTGDRISYREPKLIFQKNIKMFCCGSGCAAAIDLFDNLYVWGSNNYSQLGLESSRNQLSPVKMEGEWVKISMGLYHTLAIKKSDFSLWGWGLNNYGQLGISKSYGTRFNKPVLIDNSTEWRRVSCGAYHSAVIDNKGYLYTTGLNYHGQLGTGDREDSDTLKLINGRDEQSLEEILYGEVNSIGYYTIALRTYPNNPPINKSFYFFGDNTFGIVDSSDKYILRPYYTSFHFSDIPRDNCGGIFMIGMVSPNEGLDGQ